MPRVKAKASLEQPMAALPLFYGLGRKKTGFPRKREKME